MKQVSYLELDRYVFNPVLNRWTAEYTWRHYWDYSAHDLLILATEVIE